MKDQSGVPWVGFALILACFVAVSAPVQAQVSLVYTSSSCGPNPYYYFPGCGGSMSQVGTASAVSNGGATCNTSPTSNLGGHSESTGSSDYFGTVNGDVDYADASATFTTDPALRFDAFALGSYFGSAAFAAVTSIADCYGSDGEVDDFKPGAIASATSVWSNTQIA